MTARAKPLKCVCLWAKTRSQGKSRSKRPKSAPSRHQVKGEVTPPVTPPVERLIEVLGEHGALGAADIRDKLGLKDRAHVREAYLNPSMDAGLVEYTILEKPQSRLQRYRLTEAGRKLVEHLRQEKLN